jgi:cytoskeletal protein RodZ
MRLQLQQASAGTTQAIMSGTPSGDVGTYLRQAREARGVTLREIATATKISVRTLEALERNDPTHLPGGIFTRAFIRAFAKEIGVDPEQAVDRFVAAFPQDSGSAERPTAKFVSPESGPGGDRISSTVWLIVVISLVVGLLVVYFTIR